MLGGLPEEYRAMILGIENSGNELTVDYVKNVLLQGIPDPFAEGDDKAMPLLELKPKRTRTGYKGIRRCFKCGDKLHLLANCPKRDLKCGECGDIRHMVVKCPRRKKKSQPVKPEKTMVAFLSNDNETIKNEWFIDSGATAHMCNDRSLFTDFIQGRMDKEILVADSSKIKVLGIGTVKLSIGDQIVVLKKVNFVPNMCANLISVRRITESGLQVLFTQGRVQVLDAKKAVVIEGRLLDGMYKVKVKNTVDRACFSKIMNTKIGTSGICKYEIYGKIY